MNRYRLNVVGPFYVTDRCCTLCGVPWDTAPELFEHNDKHCWVAKQPATEQELDRMIEVFRRAELNCIRYGGSDTEIVRRLDEAGEGHNCDTKRR